MVEARQGGVDAYVADQAARAAQVQDTVDNMFTVTPPVSAGTVEPSTSIIFVGERSTAKTFMSSVVLARAAVAGTAE